MKRVLGLAIAAGAALWASLAPAQMGTAVGVNPAAEAINRGATRTLIVGADVQVGERIVTSSAGLVQIIFSDATRLVVGPGSSLVIEDYLLRGGNTAEKVTINALSGTFRFATGKSPKPAYQIKTPTATIGVRGTGFDLTVTREVTRAVVSHGSIRLCQGSQCVDLTARCAMGQSDRAEAQVVQPSQRNVMSFRQHFPFIINQNPLLRPFRFAEVRECLDAATPEVPVELPDPGDPGGRTTDYTDYTPCTSCTNNP